MEMIRLGREELRDIESQLLLLLNPLQGVTEEVSSPEIEERGQAGQKPGLTLSSEPAGEDIEVDQLLESLQTLNTLN